MGGKARKKVSVRGPTGFALEVFKRLYVRREGETWREACDRVAARAAGACGNLGSGADSGDRRAARTDTPRNRRRRLRYRARKAASVCVECRHPVLGRAYCFGCSAARSR